MFRLKIGAFSFGFNYLIKMLAELKPFEYIDSDQLANNLTYSVTNSFKQEIYEKALSTTSLKSCHLDQWLEVMSFKPFGRNLKGGTAKTIQ